MSAKRKLEELREPDGSEPFIVADDRASIRLGIVWARSKAELCRQRANAYEASVREFREAQAYWRAKGGEVSDDQINLAWSSEATTVEEAEALAAQYRVEADWYELLETLLETSALIICEAVSPVAVSESDEREEIGSYRGLSAGPPPAKVSRRSLTRSLALLSGTLDEGPHVEGAAASAEVHDEEG